MRGIKRWLRRGQGITEFAIVACICASLIAAVVAFANVIPPKADEAVEDLSYQEARTGIDPESRTKRPPHDGLICSYAIWSTTDNSLRFYKGLWNDMPYQGDTYLGRYVSDMWIDLEDTNATSYTSVPWYTYRTQVKIVQAMNPIAPLHMQYWFYGMTNLTTCDISNIDGSKSDSFAYTFYNCSALTTLDVSKLDTRLAKNMSYMFYGVSGVSELKLTKFNTAMCTNTSYMFYNTKKLTAITIPSAFTCTSVTNMSYMFYNMGNSSTAKWAFDMSYIRTTAATSYSSMLGGNAHMYQIKFGSYFSVKPYSAGLRDYARPGDAIMLTDGYWYKGTTQYTASNIPASTAATYQVASNIYGTATLTSTKTGTTSKTTTTSQSATLTCTAANYPTVSFTLKYQWYKNGSIISGATSKTYSVTASPTGTNTYYCRVTDSSGHWSGYLQTQTITVKCSVNSTLYSCTWTAYYYNGNLDTTSNPIWNSGRYSSKSSLLNACKSACPSGSLFWGFTFYVDYYVQLRNGYYNHWISSTEWFEERGGSGYFPTSSSADTIPSTSAAANGFWESWYRQMGCRHDGAESVGSASYRGSAWYYTKGTKTSSNGTAQGDSYANAQTAAKNAASPKTTPKLSASSPGGYATQAQLTSYLTGSYSIGTPTLVSTYYDYSWTIA